MHIGLIPINVGITDPAMIRGLAQSAEAAGVESVWTFEHAIVPVDYASTYPYSKTGKMPATPESAFVDPFVALAFVAGCTSTIKLGTGVNILPQANPLTFAKQVASLDVLSGGRFVLGVGVGWLKEEYAAMGTPFARRGARFDDYLVAMKKVWSADVVEHHSDFIEWSGFKSYPLPATRPHPPILVGGGTDAAFRRVVRHGSGWVAPSRDPEQLGRQLERLHAIARELDRDPATVSVTAITLGKMAEQTLRGYAALGVERVVVSAMAYAGPGGPAKLSELVEIAGELG